MPEHPKEKPDRKRVHRVRIATVHHAPHKTVHQETVSSHPHESREEVADRPACDKRKRNNEHGTLWTVGHSTRPVDDFIALLQTHGIRLLVDVRTIPRSRHNPQFNLDQLPESLSQAGIRYIHMPGLGGLRPSRPGSINTAWRNASFRGFADYMQTEEFAVALKELMCLARRRRTAIMCAEAVPWRCHRSLIADALLVHGFNVREITGKASERQHSLTPWSCVVGERVTYPSAPSPSLQSHTSLITSITLRPGAVR